MPPGTYSLQELGITSGQTLTLYVEAIRPSIATGDLSIAVSVPSTPLSDHVRFTSTQFTVLGKALDEPFQETGFFIFSTLPSPAAIGQDGLMGGAYREYRVQINDPRTTTTSVQIAGASLPLRFVYRLFCKGRNSQISPAPGGGTVVFAVFSRAQAGASMLC